MLNNGYPKQRNLAAEVSLIPKLLLLGHQGDVRKWAVVHSLGASDLSQFLLSYRILTGMFVDVIHRNKLLSYTPINSFICPIRHSE
jgi:hypothetical protein